MSTPPTAALDSGTHSTTQGEGLRRQVERAGLAGVVFVGVVAAALVWVSLSAEAPEIGIAVSLLGLVAVVVAVLRPGPLARLAGVLLLQVSQLGGEAGTSVLEAIAGVALVGYLAHWYLTAIVNGRPMVRSMFDVAAVAWGTVGLVAAAIIGQLFGADPYDFRADILATLPFLLYLPVKDACLRDERGTLVIGTVLCVFGLAAAAINLTLFRTAVTSANAWYEVADARFNVGETSITAGLMMCLAGAATASRRWLTLVLAGTAALLLGGLFITKSRGFWVSAAFGVVAMVVVAPAAQRRRILGYGLLGLIGLVAIGALLFWDQLSLIALGAYNRLISIGTASTSISLLNRFAENEAVLAKMRVNPVLGYGWGVQFTHYSVVTEGTRHWAFMHNGYLSLWYKTGLWGLGLMMAVWVGAMTRAALAARRLRTRTRDRALALAAGATIAAFTPVATTSNPFSVLDQMLIVTLVLALAHGVADRSLAPELDGRSRTAIPTPSPGAEA